MDSSGQGQSWKPTITPKYKLGAYGNVDYDTISLMADLFDKIIENLKDPYKINKLAVKGLEIYKEFLEA